MATAPRPAEAPRDFVPGPSATAISPDFRTRRDLVSRRLWRKRGRHLLRVCILVGADVSAAGLSLALALLLDSGRAGVAARWSALFPLTVLLLLAAQTTASTYGPGPSRRRYGSAFVGGLLAALGLYALGSSNPFFRVGAAGTAVLSVSLGAFAALVRHALDRAVRAAYRRGLGCQRAIVIGSRGELRTVLSQAAAQPEGNLQVLGRVSPARRRVGADCLGSITELEQVIEENAVQSVILSARLEPAAFRDIVCRCLLHGCEASLVPADLGPFPLRVSNYDLNGWPMLELEVPHLHLFQVILKRSLDILLSAVGIVLLLPVLALVALAVRLDSPGPILFQQRRLGLGGRRFTIYKFRSMRADAEGALRTDPRLYCEYVKNGFKLPADHDPRIGRVGAILRRTSLDELPQLFNVLKGDMSLVGPRPIVPEEIGRYGEKADVFLAVKPGITGYWQVNGRSTVGYPERALLDISYIRNWTLGTDLRLLLLTVVVVLWRRGAY